MFKPQIAKLGPICVRFEKQGQPNYNTLLSFFIFFPDMWFDISAAMQTTVNPPALSVPG